ncbi:MAG: 1-acyl-sn-glycerol-3-phosphate acyltransferase, partial [Dehalococcoidia bacterium]
MNPTSKLSFKFWKTVIETLFRIMTRFEIRSRENLPATGPIIAVCNHLNLIDPALHIISILPRDSIFMAKEELFRYWPIPIFRILMDAAEAFPVRRRGTPEEREEAMRHAERVLAEGLVFGIYPEGTRSRSGKLKEAYHGTAIIALRSGAPLIPVCIWGTEKLRGIGWLSHPEVTINFGKPFMLPPIEGEATEDQLKSLTMYIMKQLAAVLPPEYRGKYEPGELPVGV